MDRINKTGTFTSITAALLILLWIYTAVSKLADFGQFRHEMFNQVFPQAIARLLLYIVPAVELLAAALLYFSKSRLTGFALSFILMLAFTIYIGLALMHVYSRMPCSCGGVLQIMGWKTHLVFNLFFTAVALTGLIHTYKERRSGKL